MKTIIPRVVSHFLVAVMTSVPLVAGSVPIFQIKDGALVGAKNVVVNGQNYDVAFKGGSCTEAFGICSPSNFYFQDFDAARAATQALIDQVFVNGSAGAFDRDSSLTNGCQAYAFYCNVLTPVTIDGSVVIGGAAVNYSGRAQSEAVQKLYRYADEAWVNLSYAQWTVASTDIPEPDSVALLAIAFAGLSLSRRRR